MTPLERRCRWLLRAYPAWYRRDRAGEMLGTLLEASGPGQSWPSLRDARALVTGGLRVRGWTWSLSMLWVVAGAVGTGYDFYITTKPYTWADVSLGIEGWSTDPVAVQIAVVLATAASLALPIPALIAGFIRLRGWRPRSWLRTAAWAGAWIAGFALIYQAEVWGNYPANRPATAAILPCDRQPGRGELGGASDLCRVAGARGGADLDPGRASPRFGCARYQQQTPKRERQPVAPGDR